jgi:hypothetical protein
LLPTSRTPVTPLATRSGSVHLPARVRCVCASQKPGSRYVPDASTIYEPGGIRVDCAGPTASMRLPEMITVTPECAIPASTSTTLTPVIAIAVEFPRIAGRTWEHATEVSSKTGVKALKVRCIQVTEMRGTDNSRTEICH